MTKKTRIAVLGCTGSVGSQTLAVADAHGELFEVAALSVDKNVKALNALCEKYKPRYASVCDGEAARGFCGEARLFTGDEGNVRLAQLEDVDTVVIAITGMKAIYPLLAALKAGKRVALANKESVVCGGDLLFEIIRDKRQQLLPVDSEHSAIFQCVNGLSGFEEIRRLILTASGGPFRDYTEEQLKTVTLEQALKHPNWSMGKKITVDSSTLANKGLEVIEAHFLFGLPKERIDVLIHPTSVVHSFVETVDGALLAQLGTPDMRIPIQYALTYPARVPSGVRPVSLEELCNLRFQKPDYKLFPALGLAYEAIGLGGTATAVYNAANEAAVGLFLAERIGYGDISQAIAGALESVPAKKPQSFEEIFEADVQAREFVHQKYSR